MKDISFGRSAEESDFTRSWRIMTNFAFLTTFVESFS
jgi:hypothetical protein